MLSFVTELDFGNFSLILFTSNSIAILSMFILFNIWFSKEFELLNNAHKKCIASTSWFLLYKAKDMADSIL